MVAKGWKLFVEGGGNNKAAQIDLRKSFTQLVGRVLVDRPKPKIIAAGGRSQAFHEFSKEKRGQNEALLLVDSEEVVPSGTGPWEHVRMRAGDRWEKPHEATDTDLHFMATCMEAWIVADAKKLSAHYGVGCKALPQWPDVERVDKDALMAALDTATRGSRKGAYRKSHGWDLVGALDRATIEARAEYWARRFFGELERRASG
jgi:hypothetical protein